MTLLLKKVSSLIEELHSSTRDVIMTTNSFDEMEKALEVESFALINAIQTISFAVDTLKDKRLLAIWQNPQKRARN